MKIYLDETYDNNHTWLIIGGLFNPNHKKFHREIRQLLMKERCILPTGQLKEIKYTNCRSSRTRQVFKKIIDAFMASDSYFGAVAIKTNDDSYDVHRYGDSTEPEKIKKERAYRILAEHLLVNEMRDYNNCVLFLDKMTRCDPKHFMGTLKQNFCIPGNVYSKDSKAPLIKHIQDVVSNAEGYELMGVCDLLQGCILNNLCPITMDPKKSARNKNKIREYLVEKLGVDDLTLETWMQNSNKVAPEKRKKFNIRYVEQVAEKAKK